MRPSGGHSDAGLRAAAGDVSIMSLRSFPIGLDANAEGGRYGTALQAAAFGGRDGIVTFLVRHKANVNQVSGYNGTALQAAVVGGNEDIIRLLLDNGADAKAESGQYGTPLQAAVRSGNADIVRLLKTPLAPDIGDSNELQRNLRLTNRQALQRKLMRGSHRVE